MGGCLGKQTRESESILSQNEVGSLSHEDEEFEDFSSEEDYPIIVPEKMIYVFSPYKTALLAKKRVVSPTLDFELLNDLRTTAYIGVSKTMFIMRGVPGSGKSTLVKNIVKKYPKATVCSADDFFEIDNNYDFDVSKLPEAHQACQEKAQLSCATKCPVVIIDNTNIRMWEMRTYIEIAKSYNYHVIMLKPKTSWSNDASVCAKKNSHKVPIEVIQKKLNDFEEAIPIFYGWFLNEADSSVLLNLRKKYFLECFSKVSEFKEILFRKLGREDNVESWFEEYYMIKSPRRIPKGEIIMNEKSHEYILHCTSKYCGTSRNPETGAQTYHSSQHVQKATGKVWQLLITGLICTPDSIGARVQLTDKSMLKLYRKEEEIEFDKSFKKSQAALNDNEKKDDDSFSWESYFQQVKTVYPEKGRTAHFTLGFVDMPKDTNKDLLDICHEEYRFLAENKKIERFEVDGGLLHYYGHGFCAIYLNKPFQINAMFTGYY